MKLAALVFAGFTSALLVVEPALAQETNSLAEARAIAKEAYIYGFPMVDNYRVHYAYFVDRNGPEFKAPYRQDWYWIDDKDFPSKGLVSFIMFLLTLTETEGKQGAPIITIPAG